MLFNVNYTVCNIYIYDCNSGLKVTAVIGHVNTTLMELILFLTLRLTRMATQQIAQ